MIDSQQISDTVKLLRGASRPLFVWGAGMRPYAIPALALARSLGVPVACTWGAIDLINHDDSLAVGGFGTHGTKAANLAIQNCDLLICIGTRLDTKATGTPSEFAGNARIVMVDLDQNEIKKMPKIGREVIGICTDAVEFVNSFPVTTESNFPDFSGWRNQVIAWKEKYRPQGEVYDLMNQIAEYTAVNDIIVSDTGNTLGWIMQGFPFKGERFIHAFNFTPMGYGLGAAVGASFASSRRVVAIVGDGGALMSINELATIKRHDLNIKIILLNNKGHGMCRHTQRQWLRGNYYATSLEGGLGFPDFQRTVSSFGIDYYKSLRGLFQGFQGKNVTKPGFMEVDIDPNASLAYQVKYGEALA